MQEEFMEKIAVFIEKNSPVTIINSHLTIDANNFDFNVNQISDVVEIKITKGLEQPVLFTAKAMVRCSNHPNLTTVLMPCDIAGNLTINRYQEPNIHTESIDIIKGVITSIKPTIQNNENN